MSHDSLEVARYNQSLVLQETLQALAASLVPDAVHFSNATVCHRVLAICRLLQDADTEGFAQGLCKAGQARLALLEHVAQGTVCAGPEFLIASDSAGFSDALAAGDLDTARAIARLSASRYAKGLEYEEDFLFSRFLHLQVLVPQDMEAQAQVLERWEKVVDSGDPDLRLGVCQSIHSADASRLPDAFQALVDARGREYREYRKQLDFDPEVAATVGAIYIDGLALVRLAELVSLPVPEAMEWLPALARVSLGMRLPARESWLRIGC